MAKQRKQHKEIGKKLAFHVGKRTRRIALTVMGLLPDRTPKKTGFAAINWVPSVGAPFKGTAGTYADALQGRLDSGPQRSGVAVLRTYNKNQGRIFITNNAGHIGKLNDGSSTQAPAGFVEATVDEAKRIA